MKISLFRRILQIQTEFKLELIAKKQIHFDSLIEKGNELRIEWEKQIARQKQWKEKCLSIMCPDCEYGQTECRCHCKADYDFLVEEIRSLAGINPVIRHGSPIHDEDKSSGPVGYRVCGKDSWDNAVREYENL